MNLVKNRIKRIYKYHSGSSIWPLFMDHWFCQIWSIHLIHSILSARNEVGARLWFLQVSVILFTGAYYMLGYTGTTTPHPGTRGMHLPTRYRPVARTRYPPRPGTTPKGADTPLQTRRPLPVQCMLGDTGKKRAVRILLECNLVIVFSTLFYSKKIYQKGIELMHIPLYW